MDPGLKLYHRMLALISLLGMLIVFYEADCLNYKGFVFFFFCLCILLIWMSQSLQDNWMRLHNTSRRRMGLENAYVIEYNGFNAYPQKHKMMKSVF